MKKCPFCAEEIQDEAIKCRHCKSNLLVDTQKPQAVESIGDIKATEKIRTPILRICLYVALFVAGVYFWYLSIPLALCWFIIWKTKLVKIKKFVLIAGVIIATIICWTYIPRYFSEPSIIIISPADGSTVSSSVAYVAGRVNPSNSKITVNGVISKVDENGDFSVAISLPDPSLTIAVLANHHGSESKKYILVHRTLTQEEAGAQAAKEAEEEAAQAKKDAEAKAEQDAWNNSKAGKICNAHPGWTNEECERVANKKIWIGMSLEMMVAEAGEPDVKNLSNYGNGAEWQWCWYDKNPSCFYAGSDLIVTAYN